MAPVTITAPAPPNHTIPGPYANVGSEGQNWRSNGGLTVGAGGMPPTIKSNNKGAYPVTTYTYCQNPATPHAESIRPFQLVFGRNVPPPFSDHENYMILHLGAVNRTLAEDWDASMKILKSTENVHHSVRQEELNALLHTPENDWDTSRLVHNLYKDDVLSKIPRSMHLAGVMRDWIYKGWVLTTQTVNPDMSIHRPNILGVAVAGYEHMLDYWGGKAVPGTYLYLILKRDFKHCTHPDDAPFAFIPYVSQLPVIPHGELIYQDLTGTPRYGVPCFIGQVIDRPYGETADDLLDIQAGRVPDAVRRLMASENRLRNIYVNCATRYGKTDRYHLVAPWGSWDSNLH